MMKTCFLLTLLAVTAITLHAQLPHLSKNEKRQGWHLLFDGVSSKGWKKANGKPFPEKGWTINNGVLQIDTLAGHGGDIVTEEQFSDFELALEFRITRGANSGIKYFLIPNTSLGLEYQIIDDLNHPDAKLGMNSNRRQAGVYDLIAPSPNKKDKPVGEWNEARIISRGKHVEHWLNGMKVVEFERGSPAFKALVAGSKFKDTKGFAEAVQSPILLQEHGEVVAFRNIRIRKLNF